MRRVNICSLSPLSGDTIITGLLVSDSCCALSAECCFLALFFSPQCYNDLKYGPIPESGEGSPNPKSCTGLVSHFGRKEMELAKREREKDFFPALARVSRHQSCSMSAAMKSRSMSFSYFSPKSSKLSGHLSGFFLSKKSNRSSFGQ